VASTVTVTVMGPCECFGDGIEEQRVGVGAEP